MAVLGIDFGTSNTVATTGARPLLFDGSPLLPSAVFLGSDGRLLVGRDALRSTQRDPARFEPNPKRRIDDGTVLLGDTAVPVTRLIAAVLAHVVTEARRQLGAAPSAVHLTHPVHWGERRREVLRDAARLAGLGPGSGPDRSGSVPSVRLVAEPVAAAAFYGAALPVGRSLAIYDLGGGTFDAAVVRRTAGGFEVLASDGLPDLGGLDVDHAIVSHLGQTFGATAPVEWARLTHPADAADRRDRWLLYDDVRGAKEMLSRAAHADVHLPILATDAHLTREELETVVRPLVARTVDCLTRTIGAARLAPGELVGVFLVGGSSRIPLAARLVHQAVGLPPVTLEQPETVVVEGSLRLGSGPAAAVAAAPVAASARSWYHDPAALWTVVVLALVVVAVAVLIAVSL